MFAEEAVANVGTLLFRASGKMEPGYLRSTPTPAGGGCGIAERM